MITERRQIIRMGFEPMRLELFTTIPGLDFTDCHPRRVEMRVGSLRGPFDSAGRPENRTKKPAAGRRTCRLWRSWPDTGTSVAAARRKNGERSVAVLDRSERDVLRRSEGAGRRARVKHPTPRTSAATWEPHPASGSASNWTTNSAATPYSATVPAASASAAFWSRSQARRDIFTRPFSSTPRHLAVMPLIFSRHQVVSPADPHLAGDCRSPDRAVEDPNDLKRLPFDGEEDDVLPVAGGATAFCQSLPAVGRIPGWTGFRRVFSKDLSNSDLPVPHPKSEGCSRKFPADRESPRARG